MFDKLKLTDDEEKNFYAFVQWCMDNKKDLLKLAFNKDYMQECVKEYEGAMKNEN